MKEMMIEDITEVQMDAYELTFLNECCITENKIMVPVKTVGEGEFLFRERLQLKSQQNLDGTHKNLHFASSGLVRL